jgi:hypothetical protein
MKALTVATLDETQSEALKKCPLLREASLTSDIQLMSLVVEAIMIFKAEQHAVNPLTDKNK